MVRLWAGNALVVAVLVVVCMVGVHLPGWLKGADNLQAEAQMGFGIPKDFHAIARQTMTDAHAIATDVHRDVEIAGGTANASRHILLLIRNNLPGIFGDVKATTAQLPNLVAHGSQLEQSLTETSDKAGVVVDRLAISADDLNELLKRGWKLVDDADVLIGSDRMNEVLDGMVKTSQNAAAMTNDFRAWEHGRLFPAPYSGKFKTLHRIYVIGRGVVTLAQPAYYTMEAIGK
ncbi:MAG: hypothetical protein CXZ00_04470 [Acidobacteria bacterium]|nr:MAG: hypothetical protein CXZ00_04470 [Acidobacteriota bacterium]